MINISEKRKHTMLFTSTHKVRAWLQITIFTEKWVIVYRPTSIFSRCLFRDVNFITGFINVATARYTYTKSGDVFLQYYFTTSFACASLGYVNARHVHARRVWLQLDLATFRSAEETCALSKLNDTDDTHTHIHTQSKIMALMHARKHIRWNDDDIQYKTLPLM